FGKPAVAGLPGRQSVVERQVAAELILNEEPIQHDLDRHARASYRTYVRYARPPPLPSPKGGGVIRHGAKYQRQPVGPGQSRSLKYLKPSATEKLWPVAISAARSRIVCSSSGQSPTWLLCSRRASILRSIVSLMSTQASGSFEPER